MRTETAILLTDASTRAARAARLIYDVTHDEIDIASVLWSSAKPQPEIALVDDSSEHAHWDWSRKARTVQGLSNYRFSGTDVDGEMQGLVLWDELFSKATHPTQLGKDLLYLSFLATAPWNDRNLTTAPRYVGVGSLLILAAIEKSVELEYRGRVGLHALPQANGFYHRCGFTDLGPDLSHDSLHYFEFTPEQADAFKASFGA